MPSDSFALFISAALPLILEADVASISPVVNSSNLFSSVASIFLSLRIIFSLPRPVIPVEE